MTDYLKFAQYHYKGFFVGERRVISLPNMCSPAFHVLSLTPYERYISYENFMLNRGCVKSIVWKLH